MHRFLILTAALSLTGLSACSSTQQAAQPTGSRTAAAGTAPVYTQEQKAAMTAEERAEIYNETAEDKNRVVCRRERTVGSHMPRTICRTVAEIEAARDAAQTRMGGDRAATIKAPDSN